MTSTLEEAQEIIFGARNAAYGHPRDNFKNIADLWSAYLGVPITPLDHANMMILLKVARLKRGVYHRDSVVDISGYAGTIERLEEPIEDPLADWELADDTTWVANGRRYWSVWSEIPKDTEINSSDETDDTVPWSATGEEESFGVGPWRQYRYSEDEAFDPYEQSDREPRVWQQIVQVPRGVDKLTDDDGWNWTRRGNRWGFHFDGAGEWHHVLHKELRSRPDGPFTEVLA